MAKFQELYDFIDHATHSRKYPTNTGHGLKAALKLFEPELKDDERNSLQKFKENFDSIYQEVFRKNKNFSAGSLATYKYRVIKLLGDYERYGVDPTKMANWNPKVVSRGVRGSVATNKTVTQDVEPIRGLVPVPSADAQRMEYPLSAGSIVITLPKEVTAADMKKIKTLLDLVEVKD